MCIIFNCGGPEFNCDEVTRKTVHGETCLNICDLSRAGIVIRNAQVGHQMYTLDSDVKNIKPVRCCFLMYLNRNVLLKILYQINQKSRADF